MVVDGGQTYPILTTVRRPSGWLSLAGVSLGPSDELLVDGQIVDPDTNLQDQPDYVVQVKRAIQISLDENGLQRTLSSTAATLGQALWQAKIQLEPEDMITTASTEGGMAEVLATPLVQPISVTLKRAVPLNITVDGKVINAKSSAPTVGQALVDAGISLQTLDYSIPAEDQAVPEDGQIRVVRVREDVVLQEKTTPFGTKYEPDPKTELDQRSILVPGLKGVDVSRVRIRYEDGQEVSRQTDAEWQAQAPQDEVVGYGTKVVIRTAVVDGVTITYWRKISVYATSYSPCKQGYDHCTTGTASGIPLKKGIIAVTLDWYRAMKFQQVFIPGYGTGTIADTSGGIPGTPFMDLGFSESDFELWYGWTTVYFLTPVPAYIPGLLN